MRSRVSPCRRTATGFDGSARCRRAGSSTPRISEDGKEGLGVGEEIRPPRAVAAASTC